MRKTWNLINELTSRNSGKTSNILEITAGNKIVSNPVDKAETINEHFTNIVQVLAEDIPSVDVDPEFYLEATDKSFSLQTPSIDIALNLLKKIDDEWKTAKVTPAFKKGITSDPNNKGPITVIPIVSKLKDEMVY